MSDRFKNGPLEGAYVLCIISTHIPPLTDGLWDVFEKPWQHIDLKMQSWLNG